MAIDTVIFDAYGTLFDVTSAARAAAEEGAHPALADAWAGIAATWRERQLQYSWIRTIAGEHADFRQVTGEALDFALEAAGMGGDAGLRARMMALYDALEPYPEVHDALDALRSAGTATGILSNGSPEMLQAAVASAGIGRLLDHVLSAESVGTFKPAAAVYALVERAFDRAPGQVLFVSANGWDAAAATGHGFRTAWVNRGGAPVERLPWRPAHVVADLSEIPALAASL